MLFIVVIGGNIIGFLFCIRCVVLIFVNNFDVVDLIYFFILVIWLVKNKLLCCLYWYVGWSKLGELINVLWCIIL